MKRQFLVWWPIYTVLHGFCLAVLVMNIIHLGAWQGPRSSIGIEIIHCLWWPSSILYYFTPRIVGLEILLGVLPSILWGAVFAGSHIVILRLVKKGSQPQLRPDNS